MSKKLEKYSHIVQGIYRGYNEVISKAIPKALENLSEETRDYIVNNCWIISLEKAASWPIDIFQEEGKKWLVTLSNNLCEEEAQAIIEKEFAHVYVQYLWSLM